MQRFSVVGTSGSGKTTAARAISDKLAYPRLELDSVFHLPDWEQMGDIEFRAVASEFIQQEQWVVDGNYSSDGVLDLVWERADTVVWLDLPKRTVMRQISLRSISRAVTGEELWSGNTEQWRNLVKWDPEVNIVRWAWTRFDHTRAKYQSRINDPLYAHLDFIRLRSRRDIKAFIDSL